MTGSAHPASLGVGVDDQTAKENSNKNLPAVEISLL
jgi:hypothetical protein